MSTDYFPSTSLSTADWISQAEAARIRGVSRQAINNLVQRGKLAKLDIGGYALVSRAEVEKFKPAPAGRHKKNAHVASQS